MDTSRARAGHELGFYHLWDDEVVRPERKSVKKLKVRARAGREWARLEEIELGWVGVA